MGGPSGSMNEGRVEVCYTGVWGTATSSLFGDAEARVVCKQLGYFEYCEDSQEGYSLYICVCLYYYYYYYVIQLLFHG